MTKKEAAIPTTIRFEPETLKMMQEMQDYYMNNQSGIVNFAIKEQHKIFTQKINPTSSKPTSKDV